MRPFGPGFPAVLAPCLLSGQMLGRDRLVQFGPIGLDQLIRPILCRLPSVTAMGRHPGSRVHSRSTGGACQVYLPADLLVLCGVP
jgi:hypothetical protein